MVWIGHPWTHVRRRDGVLELSAPSEQRPAPDDRAYATMAPEELAAAVAQASATRGELEARLRRVLAGLVSEGLVEPLLSILVRGKWAAPEGGGTDAGT